MGERDEEIVARLRRFYAAFNRGDFEAAMEVAHPAIELVRPMGGLTLGAEALRAWMRPDAFEEQQIEPSEFTVNGNRVLVRDHVRAQGAGSGIEVDVKGWSVWTLNEDGLATRLEFFLDHQRAEAPKPPGFRTDESQDPWTIFLPSAMVAFGAGDDELKRRFRG